MDKYDKVFFFIILALLVLGLGYEVTQATYHMGIRTALEAMSPCPTDTGFLLKKVDLPNSLWVCISGEWQKVH